MTQRKLVIFVTEVDGDVLAEDSPLIRWELFPYDFRAVERSLDLLLLTSDKFADEQYLSPSEKSIGEQGHLLEEAENHPVPRSTLGGVQ